MSAPAPQTAQKAVPKVLRIGIAQDGKIAQERILKVGETVSVGDNPRNTFVLTGTKLPSRLELFVPRPDGYTLQVPEWVEGKISWKDGIRDLEELRKRGDGVKKGDVHQFPLDENVRGKVTIGSATLLFQFVPAPPEPVRAVTAADFRPRLWDDEDPLFMGLLGVFSLIAASFMAWVYTTPVKEGFDIEDVDAAVALVVEKPIEVIEMEDPNVDPEKPADEVKEAPKETKEESKENTEAAKPTTTTAAPTKESVASRSLLLQVIGTMGDAGSGDAVADLIGDDAASMAGLDSALAGVSGVQQADAGSLGVKSGSAGGKADATVGVGIATGGNANVGTGPATVKVKAKIVTEKEEVEVEEGDAGNIASVVKKSQGRITTCVEQALKVNASTNGRVSVGWSISAGRVTEAHLVKNSTGDDALGKCVVSAVRQFRFDPGLTAEVAEFPWVVSGQ